MTSKLQQVLTLIDAANADDPKQETFDGQSFGKEALYSQRMLKELHGFDSDASDVLTLACYAQHVCRWKVARSEYPTGLGGYLKWRTGLAAMHAEILAEAMQTAGYGEDEISRAKLVIQKKQLKKNPESQALEDVICLVFLNYYFAPFAAKYSDEKIIDIVQKTWGKMSEKGHDAALKITFSDTEKALIEKALS